MARMDAQINQLVAGAPWAGDWLDDESIMPGGAKIDAAQYAANASGYKVIPSGTVIGRTFAERAAGTPFGIAADADDEVFIVAFDVTDALKKNDVELYRPGFVVKENFLPDFGTLSAAVKAKIRATYVSTIGVN